MNIKFILNDDGLPRLRISNYYREIMAGMAGLLQKKVEQKFIFLKPQPKNVNIFVNRIQQ